MSKAYHKFEENILQLSETKVLDNLHEEWISLTYDEHVDTLERCICNREIGNVYRYLNIKTKRMINVGTDCVKKLRLKNCRSARSILTGSINGTPGNYQQICDLIKYSNENWLTFLESIKSKANSDWDNLIGLTEINKIIEFLSKNGVECDDLHVIVSKIQEGINQRNQLAETHRRWTEVINKEQEEREEGLRKMQQALCNEAYKEKIRKARLKQEEELRIQRLQRAERERKKQEEELRIQRLQRAERERKKQEELEKLLAQNAAKEKERLFLEKKAQFGKDIRERIRNEIPKCEKCNRIQRCVNCSLKITKRVNQILEEMVN